MATLNLDLKRYIPAIARLVVARTLDGQNDPDLTNYRALIWPQRVAIAGALRAEVEPLTRWKETIRLASDSFVRRYVVDESNLGRDFAVLVLCGYGALDGEVGSVLSDDMFVFAVRGQRPSYQPLRLR